MEYFNQEEDGFEKIVDLEAKEKYETMIRADQRKTNWTSVAIIGILAFTVGLVMAYFILQSSSNTIRSVEDDEFRDFLLVLNELENNHYFFDDETDLIRGAIDGMIAATGDFYTNYFTLSDFEGAMTHLRESFYGIGAEVTVINGDATIVAPMPGSPAESYGVLPGDVVISVDGEDVREENLSAVIDRIRGEYGTVVTLGILRSGSDFLYISITRGRILNETVITSILEVDGSRIGLLRVTTFGEATLRDFRNGIEELEAAGIDGLIVDLRNNGGGYLNAVNGMVSYLLPSGLTITSATDREGNVTTHNTRGDNNSRLDVEIITIINGGSASASEIFAAAMKESGGFEVLGTTSFGKGTVQQSRPITHESVLQLTIQAWRTPHGNLIEGYGVEPTIYVEPSEFLFIPQVHLGDEDILSFDMVHSGVMSAQLILELLGYDVLRTDGYFDVSTVEAIELFQQENELDITGDINGLTATALTMALREVARDPMQDNQILAALEWLMR